MAGDWKKKKIYIFSVWISYFIFVSTDQSCYDLVYRKRANKITAGPKGSSSSSGRYNFFGNQYNET